MKKTEQAAINAQVLDALSEFRTTALSADWSDMMPLRSCSAFVQYICDSVTGEILYAVLTSYHTAVAFIDMRTDTLYDVLRYVYGYTATSAQHISKFDKDYGDGKWGCTTRLTYKEV